MFKKILLTIVLGATFSTLSVAETSATNSDWFKHSAISPDGKSVLFSYQGDIFKVSSKGGTAQPLTIHSAWEGNPVWSHDGKKIAFASDRYGNLDIYVMPASGGKAHRLTYNSANDVPTDFAVDGSGVLFSSARIDSAESSIFPTTRLGELYQVATDGGTPRMISTIPGSEARYSPNGEQLLYRDEKAYESNLRKHDNSAFARDIWSHELSTDKHRQLTQFSGGDHTPLWADSNTLYFLSEQGNNNFNVWKMDVSGKKKKQITKFTNHPVRSLSMSDNNTLAFIHHGSIYLQRNKKLERLSIQIASDSHANDYVTLALDGKVTEFSVSPNGKEVAFVARGEVFVTSSDFNTTRQITNTPEAERSVSFHNDGRTLLYTSERENRWQLFEASIADKGEKYFFSSTKVIEKSLHSADSESFQPLYSPDGKKVAFLSGRDEIQVINRKTRKTNVALGKQHNYSYADGDITFSWSADSNWLSADYAPRKRLFITNIGVFPADGSAEPVDISHSGYQDSSPFWHKNGDAVLWHSSRYGERSHGSWGREFDVIASFMTQDSYDKFTMSKEEYQLAQELKEEKEKQQDTDDKKTAKKDDSKDSKKDDSEAVKPLKIEWANLNDRTVRLTKHSSDLGDAVITKDSGKLYYLARFEKGYDLWAEDFREGTTKLVAKLNAKSANIRLSEDDKKIFILADGVIKKADIADKITFKNIATKAVMTLKPIEERAYMFEHVWRQVKDKFYNPDMHGVDWVAIKKAYQAKLPSIGNNRDLARMLEEMTGELNASHIGAYYRPSGKQGIDSTAALGLIFNLLDTSGALTIAEVIDKSPLKLAKSKVRAGMKLSAIDGVTLNGKVNMAQLLNHKQGLRVRLTFINQDGSQFDEVTKPISQRDEGQLLYERWVKARRALVEKLSNGRLAYIHVLSMNDSSYRAVYSDLLGQYFDTEAAIVDTRWNGGGWLHNDLAKLLMGKEYFTMHVRGREYHGDPLDQWNKPSILVMGEGNYSDAHAFPFTYDALDIGEMVGMPVPGTMTAVWWETTISGDIRFGVPQVGMKSMQGQYLENNQIEPDHLMKNDPQSSAAGRDKQIEKAVSVMLKQLDKSN